MGWWSETIMGGDPPMDAELHILRLAQLVNKDGSDPDSDSGDFFLWEDHPERVKAALEAVPTARWDELFAAWVAERDDAQVAHQVTALMHMAVGAQLPAWIAEAAIAACATEEMIWNDAEARQAHLYELVAAIHCYDGTPTIMPRESLDEKVAKMSWKNGLGWPKPH